MKAISNPDFVVQAVERGLVSRQHLPQLLGVDDDALPLLRHLIATGLLPRHEAMMLWAAGLGHTWIDLKESLIDHEILRRLPREAAERNQVVLIYQLGEKITAVAADPRNKALWKEIPALVNAPLSIGVALPEVIAETIQLHYASFDELADAAKLQDDGIDQADLEKAAKSEQIVRLVDGLLALAVKEGASDLHLVPGKDQAQVRLRIDGLLRDRMIISKLIQTRVISRLKLLAKMDITEHRRPQDGRLLLELPTRTLEFRASTMPTHYGENIVLRALMKHGERDIPTLNQLDLGAENLKNIQQLFTGRYGIVLVVGPTGSGKTTTLFSSLNSIDRKGCHVVTVEEPVEFILAGATQVSVNRAINLDFSEILRAFMRQDPDIILIGEIRDQETASIAFEAALTGHLVFASLHASDAVQAISRLQKLGADPFVVGTSILGVLAQRLVQRICPNCRVAYRPTKDLLSRYFEFDGNPEVELYRGTGCSHCGGTGYRGRVAIYELLVVDGEMKRLLCESGSISAVTEMAMKNGFTSMRYDALKKVLRGITTLEEVDKTVGE